MSEIQSKEVLSNELVRYSRAGDAFHYRFAAKFCLDMINPHSDITEITIEGSKNPRNPSKSGEYVIDLGVYKNLKNEIEFYQLKHTSVQQDKLMNMSDIKDTIKGFSKRFSTLIKEKSKINVKFIVATNRVVNPSFVNSIANIANGDLSNTRYVNKLKEYTNFSNRRLREFCKVFFIYHSVGDYKEQYRTLYLGTHNLIGGSNGTDVVNGLIALIESRVLPDCDSPITKEDVLKRFGCNFITDLFPAPPEFEQNEKVIWRSEYIRLTNEIEKAINPIVITATGGVGKSIFTNNIEKHVSDKILVIRYDCFGNGIYRKRRNFRHRYRDFVLQVVNELSEKGLCEPLIYTNADDTKLIAILNDRLNDALKRYHEKNKDGEIIIIVDAADNACMAASNNNDVTFANEILRESFADKINLVLLCRPERAYMLDIPQMVDVFEMETFSIDDTRDFVSIYFDQVLKQDIEEFHRLTGGNPRVQSIAINKFKDFNEILIALGPYKTTVEEQIKLQVDLAVRRILDELSGDFKESVLMMCYGISLLPPDIPVKDLAHVIGINEKHIISFISELGGQIWIADGLMHFRDEPTEDWFIKNFNPSNSIVEVMIKEIEKHASTSYYLAYALPELYLRVGRYDDLIDMVSEGKFLPEDSELDIWDIELNRFKYAMKAAINKNKYEDIVRLGMIIGQKSSEQTRLMEFYEQNIDILNVFYTDEFLSDLAFRRAIGSEWNGSNVLYSASMLSFAKQYLIEARSYLRSSEKWLEIFFEEREKESMYFRDKLTNKDIFIFALTYWNLFGIQACAEYIKSWKPNSTIVSVIGKITRYFIDICNYDALNQLVSYVKENIHCLIGINGEMVKVGLSIDYDNHRKLIDSLSIDTFDYPQYDYIHESEEYGYIISFCEMLALNNTDVLCLEILDKYFPDSLVKNIFTRYDSKFREYFIRAYVIRKHFDDNHDIENNFYFDSDEVSYSDKQEREQHKGIFYKLLPWYEVLFTIKLSNPEDISELVNDSYAKTRLTYSNQYGSFNSVELEQFSVACQIFISYNWDNMQEAHRFYNSFIITHKHARIKDKIEMLRALSRKSFYFDLLVTIENDIVESIKILTDEPSERVEMYTLLSRAIMSISNSDSRAYFKSVVDEITKYGEELPVKWRAIESLSRIVSEREPDDNELSFRLIRVAEFIGEHIVRQKYWNRNEAVKIATYISPAQGLANVSRWRERDIGFFSELFASLVDALIEKDVLSPEEIWGLTGFARTDEFALIEIGKYCIKKTKKYDNKIRYIEEINDLISKNGFSKERVCEFIEFLDESDLYCEGLYQGRNSIYTQSHGHIDSEKNDSLINEFFEDWRFRDVESIKKLSTFISRTNGIYCSNDLLWKSMYRNMRLNQYDKFLEAIVEMDSLNVNHIIYMITNVPSSWKKRPGFKDTWIMTLESLGEKYYEDLYHFYYRRDIERGSEFTIDELRALYRGILNGLKKYNKNCYSEDYYDFVVLAARMLGYDDVKKYLLYMLEQFECEMEIGFGDGEYCEKMHVSPEVSNAFSSYIKVALGSPENEIRWQATHAVIRSASVMDVDQFRQFAESLHNCEISQFINSDFVFYELDYEIHMLIAIRRVMVDEPNKILEIVFLLEDLLTKRYEHEVIAYQIYQIYLELMKMFPTVALEERVKSLKERFTPVDIVKVKNIYSVESSNKYVEYEDSNYSTYLPFAFDDWLRVLERIFKIPEKHLRNMLKEAIYSNFDIVVEPDNDITIRDYREYVFRGHRLQSKTYSTHGEHPAVEDLNFYYSYHGLMFLAHRLFSENAIYSDEDEVNNSYIEWIERQLITRNDGYLLYDSKTSVPLNYGSFIHLPDSDKWFTDISTDYMETLFYDENKICVTGTWSNRYMQFNEEIRVDSALVDEEYIDSLLITLKSMAPNDYYIGESDYHDKSSPFTLECWLEWQNYSTGIEKFDSWSPEMVYPGYVIKEKYLSELDVYVNDKCNIWTGKDDGKTKINKLVWIEEYERNNEPEFCYCEKVIATEDIIDKLCRSSDKVLLLNVNVTRHQIKDRFSGFSSSEYHRYHHFKVVKRKGGETNE